MGSVIDAARLAATLQQANASLRTAYGRSCAALEALQVEHDGALHDNARLRDRLVMLEALVSVPEPAGSAGAWGGRPGTAASGSTAPTGAAYYTAGSAAYIELEELRRWVGECAGVCVGKKRGVGWGWQCNVGGSACADETWAPGNDCSFASSYSM